MPWYEWLVIISLGFSLLLSSIHIIRLIRAGTPRDFAPAVGNLASAVRYSFTGAMSPVKKESAFLHLPTYTAGIIFHTGTFLSFFLFGSLWAGINFREILRLVLTLFLILSVTSGLAILGKRIVKRELRALSNPDDYLSNILVTLFQGMILLTLWIPGVKLLCFLATAFLLCYLPLGKLKHSIYFFAARYQLGWFYGRRGVWPPKKRKIE